MSHDRNAKRPGIGLGNGDPFRIEIYPNPICTEERGGRNDGTALNHIPRNVHLCFGLLLYDSANEILDEGAAAQEALRAMKIRRHDFIDPIRPAARFAFENSRASLPAIPPACSRGEAVPDCRSRLHRG